MKLTLSFISLLILIGSLRSDEIDYPIPPNLKLGTATASYQVEGGWNEDGKGPSIWDTYFHDTIRSDESGDIACDSYHKYLEDVEMLKNLGVAHYRFSISWPRILPLGSTEIINDAGIDYYRKLVAALKENDIIPMVTIYHWDLPQALQDKGGWLSEDIVEYFADYARIVYEALGDDVQYWFTFNEPKETCHGGYGNGVKAPNIISDGVGDYLCAHNLIKAHARAYHIYDKEFRARQNGRVSIVLNVNWAEPRTNSRLNQEAAERTLEFLLGLYAHPIYHPDGNYPQVMIDRIGNRSLLEGFEESRLPPFTAEEVDYIKGTADFFALNTYAGDYAAYKDDAPIGTPSFDDDLGVYLAAININVTGVGWAIVPEGIRKLLVWVDSHYNHPEIIITENGYGDLTGQLDDQGRIDFYRDYIGNTLLAYYEDGVNVTGYTAWSLMDNLEWTESFTYKYGLYQVDFDSPERTRTIKRSGEYYKKIIATRCLIEVCREL